MPLKRAELRRCGHLLKPPLLHDPSCVLYLPFDKDDGDYVRDRSGYGNHGIIGGATRVFGKIGDALSFDGIDDRISFGAGNSLNIVSDLSCALWAKISPSDIHGGIVYKADDANTIAYELGMFTSKLFWRQANETNYIITDTIINDDIWHFIAVTRTGDGTSSNSIKVYVDGLLVFQSQLPNPPSLTTLPLRIGESFGLGFITAILDEVRIYNRVLSTAEIRRLMNMRGV